MSIKKARETLQNKEKFNFGILDEVANSGWGLNLLVPQLFECPLILTHFIRKGNCQEAVSLIKYRQNIF